MTEKRNQSGYASLALSDPFGSTLYSSQTDIPVFRSLTFLREKISSEEIINLDAFPNTGTSRWAG